MQKKRIIQIISILFIVIFLLMVFLFVIRVFSPREIDDVSPEIPCEKEYIEKSDILWVIPKFNDKLISENKTWCSYILSLNKTIGLHGVTHQFEEFKANREREYLVQGIEIFEQCFGFKPTMFKPPQLKISKENKKLINKNNIKLKLNFNQLIHKVYHCNDTGKFKNKIIDLV